MFMCPFPSTQSGITRASYCSKGAVRSSSGNGYGNVMGEDSFQQAGNVLDHLGDPDIRSLECGDFAFVRSAVAEHHRAGVADVPARRDRPARDERRHWLAAVLRDELRRALLLGSSDFADEKHRLGLGIGLEELEAIAKARAAN